MISSLQSLRGIFTIFIFLHHIADFGAGGDSGVAFFMILSGFVMCNGYESLIESDRINFKKYINKRLARIYPLHIVCLLVAILLKFNTIHLGPGTLAIYVSNALLLQSWIPLSDFYFSGNAVSWFLSDLLFCYAAFPFIIRFVEHHKSKLPVFLGVLFSVYFCFIILLPSSYSNSIIYINPVLRILDFIIGIILWQWWRQFREGRKYDTLKSWTSVRKSAIEVTAVVFYICAIILYPYIYINFATVSFWWIPTVCIIAVFSVFNESGGVVTKLLHNHWLIWFGDISFSFYMIHMLVFQILQKVFPQIADIGFTFIITLIAAYFVNRYFEKPVGRRWIAKTSRAEA